MNLGIGNLANLLDILHDDTIPNRPHAVLALCSLKDLSTIDRSATRLGDLCRLRARELFQVAAQLSGTTGVDRADVLRLLDHAATALEEAEHWATLATSARTYYQHPKRARHAARAITAAWPALRETGA